MDGRGQVNGSQLAAIREIIQVEVVQVCGRMIACVAIKRCGIPGLRIETWGTHFHCGNYTLSVA